MTYWLPALATAIVALIAIISARNYDHREARYAGEKTPASSIAHFRFVYRYLQITSIGAAIGSFWLDHPFLMELHHSRLLMPFELFQR